MLEQKFKPIQDLAEKFKTDPHYNVVVYKNHAYPTLLISRNDTYFICKELGIDSRDYTDKTLTTQGPYIIIRPGIHNFTLDDDWSFTNLEAPSIENRWIDYQVNFQDIASSWGFRSQVSMHNHKAYATAKNIKFEDVTRKAHAMFEFFKEMTKYLEWQKRVSMMSLNKYSYHDFV